MSATEIARSVPQLIDADADPGTPRAADTARDALELGSAATQDIGAFDASGSADAVASSLSTHVADISNPHGVTKAQVGLGSADDTSDANKPISTATATALAGKQGTGTAVLLAGSYADPSWITSLSGSKITGSISGSISGGNVTGNIAGNANNVTGIVALANGGTGIDLSATGGTGKVVKQSTLGGAFTVAALVASDIPDLSATYQPLDADLTAIAAISTNGGYLVRTAANTWVQRTPVGTSNQITITNGDGIAGAPTYSLPSTISLGTASGANATVESTSHATKGILSLNGTTATVSASGIISSLGSGGSRATVVGNGLATASGTNSTAFGSDAQATSTNCVAVGMTAVASVSGAVAIGASATAGNARALVIGQGLSSTATGQIVMGSVANSAPVSVYFGNGVTHLTAPVDCSINPTGGGGTDILGGSLYLCGGRPTGSGAGGTVRIQTANAGASGVTLRTLVDRIVVEQTGNIALWGAGSYGGGVLVGFVANCTTAPTSNPTGGGILYAESGAGKWRGSSGTVTTFGTAEPHCPQCGADFMTEHENPKYGYLSVCLKCMADELGERPWIIRRPAVHHIGDARP